MYQLKTTKKIIFVLTFVLVTLSCNANKKQLSDLNNGMDENISVQKLYSDIEIVLEKVDFNKIWQGFSCSNFALYNQETVYFKDTSIPWDERFLGNTVIDYNGSYIAIWSLDTIHNEDPEYLAADMVHEMFHVYQRQNGETRYSVDLELLAYPDDLDNYQVKMAENELLVKAFLEKNTTALNNFINLRNARMRLIGDNIYQEYRVETTEGMAEYAGLTSLQQINPEKYNERIENHISKLLNSPETLFSPRHMAYYSGAILCSTLKSLNIDFYHELSEKMTLFEIISNNQNEFSVEYDKHVKNKIELFDNFLKNHTEVIQCDEFIYGYDPMNMVRLDNKILCSNFVIIGDQFIKGPVLLILRQGTINHVESYMK